MYNWSDDDGGCTQKQRQQTTAGQPWAVPDNAGVSTSVGGPVFSSSPAGPHPAAVKAGGAVAMMRAVQLQAQQAILPGGRPMVLQTSAPAASFEQAGFIAFQGVANDAACVPLLLLPPANVAGARKRPFEIRPVQPLQPVQRITQFAPPLPQRAPPSGAAREVNTQHIEVPCPPGAIPGALSASTGHEHNLSLSLCPPVH